MSTDNSKIKYQARKIAAGCQVKVVYRNSNGEFFTNKNAADNSDKPENIQTFDFSDAGADTSEAAKKIKLVKKSFTDNPGLAEKGWEAGDEVESIEWALANEKKKA